MADRTVGTEGMGYMGGQKGEAYRRRLEEAGGGEPTPEELAEMEAMEGMEEEEEYEYEDEDQEESWFRRQLRTLLTGVQALGPEEAPVPRTGQGLEVMK